MLELALLVFAAVAMGKIAASEDDSPLIWIVATIGLGIGSIMLLPELPFVRVILATVAAFILMIVYKMIAKK